MDPKINVVSSDQIDCLRLGMQGSASTWGQQSLHLSPGVPGQDCSHDRAWLLDLHCVQPREVSAGDGELSLAADLTGGEVLHQSPPRLFLGPKLQQDNVTCLYTNVCTFSPLLSCTIWAQSPLMWESREMWRLFMLVWCLDAAQPHHSLSLILQPSYQLFICPFCCAKSDPVCVTWWPFPRNTRSGGNWVAEKERTVLSSAVSFS